MGKKLRAVILTLLLCLAMFGVLDFSFDIIEIVSGDILYVNSTGSGGAYPSIQYAIDNASDGDTVFVFNGTYNENVVVNKSINLIGENRYNTTIDGGRKEDVVHVDSHGVNITNFTMIHGGRTLGDSIIELHEVQNCRVSNITTLGRGREGILLSQSSNNTIAGNSHSNSGYAVFLRYSDENIIQGNTVNMSSNYGILLYSSNRNKIIDNNISNGAKNGFTISSSNGNNIINNTAHSNPESGIYSINSSGNNIMGNKISSNYYGIELWTSNDNNLVNNNVFPNNICGIRFDYSDFNNVIDNEVLYNKYGIDICRSDSNNIFDNTANSNSNVGIYLRISSGNNINGNNASYGDHGICLSESSQNNITFNNASYNNMDGIQIGRSINNSFQNNTMVDNGIFLSGIKVDYWNSHDIDISNTVNGKPVYYLKNQNGGSVPPGAGQVILANCTEVIVESQELGNGSVGVELGYCSNNTVANNSASSNSWYGFYLWKSNSNTLTGNYVSQSGYRFMVDGNGICLESSNENELIGNNASHNQKGRGIYLWNSTNNTISENILLENYYGIMFSSSSSNDVISNTASNNTRYGFWIIVSNQNNITCNNLSGNNCGIDNVNSNENIFEGNNISDNIKGINLENSANNTIFHNNFLNNAFHADDDSENNFWDGDYPMGGNYWSDYVGTDLFKGPNQNIPGSDGIGDSPYTAIYGGYDNQDNYPLMDNYIYKPLENYTILMQGWNMISIPQIQDNQFLVKVLEMIDGWYDAVQWFDPTDTDKPWKHYNTGKLFGNDLSELNETMGFWIHITHPGETTFLYNGTQPIQNQTIPLYQGWNMVGYPSRTSYNRTVGLNNLTFGQEVDLIQWYDPSTQTWHDMAEDDYFVKGRGYWIHAKNECEWEVPV